MHRIRSEPNPSFRVRALLSLQSIDTLVLSKLLHIVHAARILSVGTITFRVTFK